MEKDILIIGSGPAGLSTALHLRKIAPELSSRILILEKARHPRVKLCAGGLVGDAEVILQRLGLDVSEIPHVDGSAAHFDFEGRGLAIRVPGTHTLRVIRRNEFDAWLARKTREQGIEIMEGVTVKSIAPDDSGVTVETDAGSFRALIVVGADGSNGIVRRCIFPNEPLHTARVLELLAPPNEQTEHGSDEAYFDFFPVTKGIAGYTWDFPTQLNGQPMRCWGIYDANIAKRGSPMPLRQALEIEMKRLDYDINDYELKGHPIRWFAPSNKMAVPRVLLAGDAVGADAIFGEGISMALGYGFLAAQEVANAIKSGDFSLSGYQKKILNSSLGDTLKARWFIAEVIFHMQQRWFHILLWRIIKPIVILSAWVFVLNWAKRLR